MNRVNVRVDWFFEKQSNKYELVYSPDLASSDSHLFRTLKDGLCGKRFSNIKEVIIGVKSGFGTNQKNNKGLPEKLDKCEILGMDMLKIIPNFGIQLTIFELCPFVSLLIEMTFICSNPFLFTWEASCKVCRICKESTYNISYYQVFITDTYYSYIKTSQHIFPISKKVTQTETHVQVLAYWYRVWEICIGALLRANVSNKAKILCFW